MTRILYLDPINDKQVELDFSDLVSLIKGSSIKSMAISDEFFELGLSDAFNLRIETNTVEQTNTSGPTVFLSSTLNKGQLPPVRLKIIQDREIPTAIVLEKRIHALRQLYATAFLINAGRTQDLVNTLEQSPSADLETSLLRERDRLFITAASEGSFWITLLTRTKAAFKTLSLIGPMFYDEGRQALLERLRATTELKKLDVKAKQWQISFDQSNNCWNWQTKSRK